MDFDYFYSKQQSYFGVSPSDGLVTMLDKFELTNGNALDIGAGEGRNSLYLASLGFNVTAVEPTQDGALKIKKRAEEMGLAINIINQDYLAANISDYFDFIIAGTSLDHMETNYLLEAIKKLRDSLRVGGYIYIVVFTEKDPGYLHDLNNASECSTFINHYFKENELRDYFNDYEILFYDEYLKPDNSHGKPHVHGKAKIIARKI